LRTEIAEGFISSLKNVFAESYIEIPEAKKDLVESLNSNVAKLEDKVKKQNAIIFEQKKKNDQLLRKSILESSAKGLAITQVAKLNDLTKDIPFETAEAFQKKVAVIKESYFGKRNSSAPQIKPSTVIVEGKVSSGGTTEVIVEGQEDPTATLPSDMKRYVAAISRSNR
jgi:activator of HSP90 ATPase